MSQKIEAGKYISMYGPTVGDKVRLGDTDLFIEVEKGKDEKEVYSIFNSYWDVIFWGEFG